MTHPTFPPPAPPQPKTNTTRNILLFATAAIAAFMFFAADNEPEQPAPTQLLNVVWADLTISERVELCYGYDLLGTEAAYQAFISGMDTTSINRNDFHTFFNREVSMTHDETATVLTIIRGAYPIHALPDETVMLWANAFARTDYGQLRRALGRWIEDQSFPPTIADLNHQMMQERRQQERELAYTSRPDPTEVTVSFSEGQQIARNAYIDDCEKRGRVPNLAYFDRAIGIVKS